MGHETRAVGECSAMRNTPDKEFWYLETEGKESKARRPDNSDYVRGFGEHNPLLSDDRPFKQLCCSLAASGIADLSQCQERKRKTEMRVDE